MKLLFLYNYGFGNCIQQIPLYLALEKEYGRNIDCYYLIQVEGDNPKNADCTPNPICPAVQLPEIVDTLSQYDYIIKPPFIYESDGSFIKEHIDSFREMDSEVARNGRIAEFLGIDYTIERRWRSKALNAPEGYVCVANCAAPGWDKKRYNKFEEIVWLLGREGIRCISIGGLGDAVFGAEDYTGCTWRETASLLEGSIGYLGTDTGAYHLAALIEKPGVAIFTQTSIGKNWDKDFHHTIKTIQRTDLECCPCQLQYHWSHKSATCQNPVCGDIDPKDIFNLFMETIS